MEVEVYVSDERWREKYYDKVEELRQVEKKLFECANSKADGFLKYRNALKENEIIRGVIKAWSMCPSCKALNNESR